MIFIIISIVWLFIALISFFGDYKTKELENEYKYEQDFMRRSTDDK